MQIQDTITDKDTKKSGTAGDRSPPTIYLVRCKHKYECRHEYNYKYKYRYRGTEGDVEVATGDSSPPTIYLVCCTQSLSPQAFLHPHSNLTIEILQMLCLCDAGDIFSLGATR